MRKTYLIPILTLALSLTSCSVNNSPTETPSSDSAHPTFTPTLAVASDSTTPSSSESSGDSLLSQASASEFKDGIHLKYTFNDMRETILSFSPTHIASLRNVDKTIRVADLSTGQDIFKIDSKDLNLPDSVEFIDFQRATLLKGTIIVESLVKKGEDKYNQGEDKTLYSVFDFNSKQLLGEPIFGKRTEIYNTDPLISRKPDFSFNWKSGVPGKSVALAGGSNEFSSEKSSGNIIIFEDMKPPKLVNHDSEEIKRAYFISDNNLVQIEDSFTFNRHNQLSENTVSRESSSVFDPAQLLTLDSNGNILSSKDLPSKGLSLAGVWMSPAFCVNPDFSDFDNSISSLPALEVKDIGDVSCREVSPNGTVLGTKGDKAIPVLLSADGDLIDLDLKFNHATLLNDSLIYNYNSGEIYEYKFKKNI